MHRCLAPGIFLMLFLLSGCVHRVAQVPQDDRRIAEKALAEQAESYFRQGDLPAAMAAYSSYLSQFPQGRQADKAMRRLGDIYCRQGQYGAAQAFYQKMIKQFPYSAQVDEVRLALVDVLIETGRETEALQLGRQMAEGKLTETVRRQLWRRLERLHCGAGEYTKAARYAYSVYASAPDAEKKFWLNRLMENLGHLQPADLNTLGMTVKDDLLHGFLTYRQAELAIKAGAAGDALELLSTFETRFAGHPLSAEVARLIEATAQEMQFEPYTIGCLLPLSGPYGGYGRSALNGIELAISRQQVSDPPPPIKLIIKDSAATPNSSVSAIQELARERVGAIIGPMTDVEAAAREAQKQSVPLITLTQKQDITAVGSYVFRHFITPQNQVASLVDYLIGHLGLRTFAVLYPKETYGQTFKDLFWDAVVKRGGQMTALQTYDPRQTDFTDTIKNLVKAGQDHARQSRLQNEAANPSMEVQDPAQAPGLPAEGAALAAPEEAGVGFEALFIPDSTQKAALILPQLATYDVGGLTLAGTNLWHSEKLLPLSGAFDGRIVVADGFFKDSRLPAARHFVHEYRAIYNQDPGLIEALAFDTANFLFGVMGRPDIRWRNSLLSAMKQQTMNEGASGPLFFDEFGEAQKTLFLLRIQDGRFVEADDL